MKVIVCGGRDYVLSLNDRAWLSEKLRELGATEVVSGGATGADAGGEAVAQIIGIPVAKFSANWKDYGKRAGPMRNREMANYADAVIAFPGGSGTDSMLWLAAQKGLKVIEPEAAA